MRYLTLLLLVIQLVPCQAQINIPILENWKSYDSLRAIIVSDRNQDIPLFTDLPENTPEWYSLPGIEGTKEIWFPMIDLQLDHDMKLVLNLEGFTSGDTACWNGNIVNDCRPIQRRMIYDENLEYWENQLFVISKNARITSVEILQDISKNSTSFKIHPLSKHWSGTIQIEGLKLKKWTPLADTSITISPQPLKQENPGNLDRSQVDKALLSTVNFLRSSQNTNPLSPYYGGLYLIYDVNNLAFRRSDWVWAYGPSIKLLVEASKVPSINHQLGHENVMTSARLLAESSLRFQINNPEHPANGLTICRYDPRLDTPHGAEGYCSPADSYFLAGWGWMPYYQATGDKRFLDAGIFMTEEMERILTYDEIVEQDYLLKINKWKNWTMDESGFGMKGAEGVYLATQNEYHQAIGRNYISGLLKHLEREDGLWDRTWHRNSASRADNGWPVNKPKGTPQLIETKYSTRGLGWAMIGLLASHGMMPDEGYLDKAIRMAEHLMANQQQDGYWSFLFKGGDENEISVKGTTLWSLLFYELYSYTGDPRHLATARKALQWCISQQERDVNSPIFGGITETNRESGVVYCRWHEVVCTYSMAWFGLALIEELKYAD